jgi:hypothetical protein
MQRAADPIPFQAGFRSVITNAKDGIKTIQSGGQ